MIPVMYRSQDTSAPALTNALGALTTLLDAVLVTGYATQTLTSLTHSAGIITGTLAAHGYTVGQVISISGAAQDEYNGRVTVLTVPTSSTFTYAPALSNPAVTPATGTLKGNTAATAAALGWQLVATGTNTRLYRPRFGTRMYLGMDDNVFVANTSVRAFETASAAGISVTGTTGAFPTAYQHPLGIYWQKTNNVASTPNWIVLGDDKGFYYQSEVGPPLTVNQVPNCHYFGDFISYVPNDLYNCVLFGKPSNTGNSNSNFFSTSHTTINLNPGSNGLLSTAANGKFLCRPWHQSGGGFQCYTIAQAFAVAQHGISGSGTPSGTVFDYPYKINGAIFVSRAQVFEPPPSCLFRGHMRGLYHVCHDVNQMQALNVFQQLSATDGINKLTIELRRESAGMIAFETGREWV